MALDVSVGTDVEVDGAGTVRVGAAVAGKEDAGALTGLGVQSEIAALNVAAITNRSTVRLLVLKFMISLPFHSFPPQ